MNTVMQKSLAVQAVEALNARNRQRAVALLRQDIETAPAGGQRWLDIARLASTIGEKGLELEALYKFAHTQPQTLDHVLAYAQGLSRNGRSNDALSLLEGLPAEVHNHPAVLHFRGMVASETGRFADAEACFRRALAAAPTLAQSWHGLSVIKTFVPGDPDIAAMEGQREVFAGAPPAVKSLLLYALGKAYDDTGDFARAAATYREGAEIMRAANPYDGRAWQAFVRKTNEEFNRPNMAHLIPSGVSGERVTFVTGLPRSGTTLVEQILTSHSKVTGGDELNITDGILGSVCDLGFESALAYQDNDTSDDPWGDLARDYLRIVAERFGPDGRVIDKTLNQSRLMGLLLHMLPNARVVWLRRSPEDNALSIFRTHFRDSLPWTWSLSGIAGHMRGEDALYQLWMRLFGDRILSVPYEGLVSDPQTWTRKILAHVGLDEEPQVFAPHEQTRSVTTASVAQVRQPISHARIGAAQAYGAFMNSFREVYNAPRSNAQEADVP